MFFCCITMLACTGEAEEDPFQAFSSGDYQRSYQSWLPAARAGDAEAQYYIAVHYQMGLSRPRDMQKAAAWYVKSAKQGYPGAQRNYGVMLYDGTGVKQDYLDAFTWLFAASQQGHQGAKRQVDSIAGQNKLSPNQMLHAKLKANQFIVDPVNRFHSRKLHQQYLE